MSDIVEKLADNTVAIRDGLVVRFPDESGALAPLPPTQIAIGRVYGITGGWFPVAQIGEATIHGCRFACIQCNIGAEVYLAISDNAPKDDRNNLVRSVENDIKAKAASPPHNCEHVAALTAIMQAVADPANADIQKALHLLGLELQADYEMRGINRAEMVSAIAENVMQNLQASFMSMDNGDIINNAPGG